MAVFNETMNRGDSRTIERAVHRVSVATGVLWVFADGDTWHLSEGQDCEPGDGRIILTAIEGTNFAVEYSEPTGTEPPAVDPTQPVVETPTPPVEETTPAEVKEDVTPRGDSAKSPGNTGSYESRTVKELRELAKERDIEGYSQLNKADLIKALRNQ